MLDYLQDVFRGLRSGKRVTVLGLIILTLAMSGATVTYSVVYAVVIKPLPYKQPGSLLAISRRGSRPDVLTGISPANFATLTDSSATLQSIGASRPHPNLQFGAGDESESVAAVSISARLFDVLGVTPAAGRWFGPEHERPGAPPAVILGYDLWRRSFGADPTIIGSHIKFADVEREVVGILPKGVWYPLHVGRAPEVFLPYVVTPAERANDRVFPLIVVGRLKDGVSIDAARQDILFHAAAPLIVQPLAKLVVGPRQYWLVLLLACVSLVLLIAFVNVGNLLILRSAVRAREFVVRSALGASRARLVGTLVGEGLALSLLASAGGSVFSVWGVETVKTSVPLGLLSRAESLVVDAHILGVAAVCAVVCGVLFSIAPAWLATSRDLAPWLSGGHTVIGNQRVTQIMTVFLVVEIAFVCVLSVASALVVHSLMIVDRTDLGFDRRNVASISFKTKLVYATEAERIAGTSTLNQELLSLARDVPGVIGVAISASGALPLSGSSVRYSIALPGSSDARASELFETRIVTPDYFSVLQMHLLKGRVFLPSDNLGAPSVVAISDIASALLFGSQNPLGQAVVFNGRSATVVGVLRALRINGPESDAAAEVYVPIAQEPSMPAMGYLVVRTGAAHDRVVRAVRDAIRPVVGEEARVVRSQDESFRELTAVRRFNSNVMTAFGLIGIVVAALGVYGTMTFSVAEQFRTIGLCMALGASRGATFRSVVAKAVRPIVIGLGIGVAISLGLSGLFSAFVFGITPYDVATYVAVCIGVAAVGLLATIKPAWQASMMSPLDALRRD